MQNSNQTITKIFVIQHCISMITKTEKEKIKKILGWRYAPLVQAYMNKKGYFNSNGLPYSTAMIVNVMNGIRHDLIEEAIFELTALKKAQQEAHRRIL